MTKVTKVTLAILALKEFRVYKEKEAHQAKKVTKAILDHKDLLAWTPQLFKHSKFPSRTL